jgi:hypothetical protein
MMKIFTLITLCILLHFSLAINAQNKKDSAQSFTSAYENTETRDLFKRQGDGFFYWGYNRASFSNSDMRFHGDGYDFTITNIRAVDEPSSGFGTYLNPGTISVPQFNLRFGYYLTDKTFITIGYDHMKYGVLKQSTYLTGYVSKDHNQDKNVGTYSNTEVEVGEESEAQASPPSIIDSLKKGFVSNFEHCDGLNDVCFELGRIEQLWISKNHLDALSVVGTVSMGMEIPDTDADVLGYPPKHDMSTGKKAFHLAGYSLSASIGLQFDFFKHFFLQARLKGGYINMPDINTTTTGGKASQHFDFLEPMMVIGYTHSLCKK